MKFIFFNTISLLLFLTINISASIVNTKHNLSVSGTGTIKASTETEVCVFCHIPHFANTIGKPLWNRSMPISDYTLYDSDYLRRMDYPIVADNLGVANDEPGALSRQCLSCHDGTVAVGAVSKLRRDYDATITMNGVDGSGYIPVDASSSFSDLNNHHPIGIEYDPTPTIDFSDETRGMELKAINVVETEANVKLYDYAGVKHLECSSCHDPHKDNSMFLHVSGGNHAQNVVNTCTSCHDKTGWTGSVHQLPPVGTLDYTDPDILTMYGTQKIADLGCANCHTPHNALGEPYLNRQVQATTCYQGAASSVATANCHGVGGAKDIESVVAKFYAHPVGESTETSKHTNLDVLYGYDSATDTEMTDARGVGGMSFETNRHAVCMDCHNPHQAQAGTHVTIPGAWYEAKGETGNAVSPALTGVTGLKPVWPASWEQPKTFDIQNSASKEYQICIKCHSYWGLGPSTNGVTTYTSINGTILTDVAWEMNINNRSGHPVVVSNSLRPGSYAPKELDATQLMPPWDAFSGTNTMYCSDCHGNDTEASGDPKGPHGSALAYLLKGDNQYWPLNANGNLYTIDDIGIAGIDPGDDGLFCKNCHDISEPHTLWTNKMKNQGFKCVECHVVIPHGSPVSRLLGYSTFPEPYNYPDAASATGGSLKMIGYRKNLIVDETDAHAPDFADCNANNCHRNAATSGSAYDDVPPSM